ncbi:MAG: ATP-binding protein [Candidatus Omnitrophota bacterium]
MNYLSMLTLEKEKDTSYVYVLDDKGMVLAGGTEEALLIGKQLTDEFTKNAITAQAILIQKQGGIVDVSAPIKLGPDRLATLRVGFSTKTIQGTITGITKTIGQSLRGLIMTAAKNMLFLTVVIAVLVFVLGLVFIRGIVLPINKLALGTKKIADGDFAYKLDIKSEDEIGQLAVSFNKMSKDLKHLIEKEKELASTKATAETEKLRADELEKAYKKLEEMQDMIIQAEKLNAVGQLASGVAHEVKNPLGIVLQGVNYLESKLSSKSEFSEIMDMIKNNITRADNIVCGLVDFSRASQLDIKPGDINPIIKKSLVLTQHNFRLKNIEIFEELKRDLPKVLIDKTKIEQVFVNMFLNAIQAMADGGKLFIRSYAAELKEPKKGIGRRIEDHFELGEKVVCVEIEDTGEGISEENLKKIFNPFFTTKQADRGTGLGLSVSRNIIIMHKGLIEVKSTVGKGTNIIITLKIEKEA